ncbi:MAG TPA: pyridoxal-dependent decarboxylase [Methylomirabilota bacterium]|nr:pyridoxal-dependent decarboxylase [Methylomirabilota bacterium]
MLGDLPGDELRAALHRTADWIADYRDKIEQRRVTPEVRPGEIAAVLPPAPPESPERLSAILDDVDRVIMPGIVHWGHPAFLGYFGSTTTAPGILGDVVAAALNVSAMTWRTSPAATELETVVLDWLRRMIGLPDPFMGVVYDTASIALVHALAAAREATGLGVRRDGLAGRGEVPKLMVYASDQAHGSLDKAAITLGLGESSVRRVDSDTDSRMSVAGLRAAIARDLTLRRRPFAVVATVGTTSSTAVDPVEAIADVCAEHGLWLHVDAAYGAALALLEEGRWVMAGVDRADSVVVNPHTWLFVPPDFSALYTRRPEMLRAVFLLTPDDVRGDAGQAERNYMDYGLQLGRRFRALKAWMVFRAFGRAGLEARIREHCRLAQLVTGWITAEPGFELLAPVTMGVVCFRATSTGLADAALDEHNARLLASVNATGRIYLTQTRLRGRLAIRLAIGNILTTEQHLEEAWTLIRLAATTTR